MIKPIFLKSVLKVDIFEKKLKRGRLGSYILLSGGCQNHNGFKLDLASEYGISRSQLALIIASNNDYMIIKERTKLKRR